MSGSDRTRLQGAQALLDRAKVHIDAGDWPRAADGLRAVLAAQPGHAETLLQLSYVESLAGHYRAAKEAALAAMASRPSQPKAISDLLARLRTFNEAERLLSYVRSLGPPSRVPIPLLLACAAPLANLNLAAQALDLLDEALWGDPDYPPSNLARAQVLMYLGRFDDAAADALRVVRRAPQIAQAWWLLSQLRRWSADDNHVHAIRSELTRPGRNAADIAMLQTALHKELDDLGDHEAAWRALEQACAAKRSTLNYDRKQSRDLVDALIALDAGTPVGPTDAAHVPVFILGMHRSGTTLLEQLLDGSPQVRGVGELYDFTSAMRWVTDHHCQQVIDAQIVRRAPQADLAEAGRRYLAGMQWRLGEERLFTDKLPSNFLNIGFICQALPQAKILHMVRDPVETCFSNLRELFSSANPYSYDQAELADFYLQYRRLMAHWHAAYPGRILDVDYAELTCDPKAVMRKVASFCGIDYIDAMSDPRNSTRAVSTASAVQVREGVIAREVPKWAPYAHKLSPLIEALRAGGVEAG